MDYDVTVIIVPDTSSTFNGSSIQMTLSYNTKYNVTVRLTLCGLLCGENSAQTQRVLEYGPTRVSTESQVKVMLAPSSAGFSLSMETLTDLPIIGGSELRG